MRQGPTHDYLAVKRAIDIVLAVVALIALSPVLLVAAVLTRLSSPGPIFFRQERLGYRGRTFSIYKFRTMTDKPRAATEAFGNHPEVTAVGAVLRRLKIDELPQVINVLIGDMSIVGPRPGLPEQLAEYTPQAWRRLDVRPGLTGLAQVNGNIYLSWPERWEYDAQYVETLTWWLDLRIILKTVAVVLAGEHVFARRTSSE